MRVAKKAIGDAALFVDANGAYSVKQALAWPSLRCEAEVAWFEEPVSSDDLDGLRAGARRGAAGMDIAAGEYGYNTDDVRHMLARRAVDVQQADASRAAASPASCKPPRCARPIISICPATVRRRCICMRPAPCRVRHLEWFHDHVRIEQMLFDGALSRKDGAIRTDMSRPGLGLEIQGAGMRSGSPYDDGH